MALGTGGTGRPEPGAATAMDMVEAMRRVAAAIAAAPLIAAKVDLDSRVSPYEVAELVREVEHQLFGG